MTSWGLLPFLLLPALSPLSSSLLPNDVPVKNVTLANMILSSLEQAILYLNRRNPSSVDIDILMYLRILDEDLQASQETWAKDPFEWPLTRRIRRLSRKVIRLFEKYTLILTQRDPIRIKEFYPVIHSGFWKLPHTWRHTKGEWAKAELYLTDSPFSEETDTCLIEVLGVRTSDPPCTHSLYCDYYMEEKTPISSYQMLYYLFSKMLECTRALFEHTPHYLDQFCTSHMATNLQAMAKGFATDYKQFFLRSIVLCGVAGFVDVYKPQWLETILLWQNTDRGCYKPDPPTSKICSIPMTAVAAGAMGGFFYALTKNPEALEGLVQFTTSSTGLLTSGINVSSPFQSTAAIRLASPRNHLSTLAIKN